MGSRGVVLVVDPPLSAKISEELWLVDGPKRLMVWGKFDEFLTAVLPAKELRARIRRKGIGALADRHKSEILARFIDDLLRKRAEDEYLKEKYGYRYGSSS